MKKIGSFGVILSVTLLIGVTLLNTNSNIKPRDIAIHGSHVVYEYNDLEKAASTIALVRITDTLSKENSTVVYEENSPFIQSHYATREAEVITYYKNDLNLGGKIKINEPVAITKDNDYIHPEEYNAFQENENYIVYLSTDNGLGQLSIISRNNGRIQLDDFSNNEYKDIAIRSVLSADGINLPVNTPIKYIDNNGKKVRLSESGKMTKKINRDGLNLVVNYSFDEKSNTEYLNIDGIEFAVPGKIYSK